AHGGDGVVERLDEEAVLAVPHDLDHRSAPPGDHRRAAGHCLDDAEAERLVEVHEMQERERTAEQASAPPWTARADVANVLAVEPRLHEALEVVAILDDPRNRQRHADTSSDIDRLGRSLVGMDPPE